MSKFVDRPRYVCALGGALGTLRAIPRAIPVIHAAAGCGGNLSNAISPGAGHFGSGYTSGLSIPSSNVLEKDIVFGGEERLREQIETTLEIMDGDLYVVVTGCMVEMIGDDAKGVTSGFEDSDKPVLVVETGGFKGNSYTGYDLLLEELFKNYVTKTEKKIENAINIFGLVPGQDAFYKGNLRELKRILGKLGIKVNTFFGEGETLEDIKRAGEASLNLVVSDIYGIEPAKAFEQIHGVPFVFLPLPIGARATEEFVYTIGKELNVKEEIIKQVIKEEKEVYYDYFERISDIFNDLDFQRYAVVVGDANYTTAVTRFVSDELGWIPSLTVITDFLEEDQEELLLSRFENYASGLKPKVVFDTDASSVKKHLKTVWPQNDGSKYFDSFGPAIIIGSSFERDLSEELGYPLLTVSFPVTNKSVLSKGYAGFYGGLNLLEDLITIYVSGR